MSTAEAIAALRMRVAAIEGRASEIGADAPGGVWRLGVPAIDAAAGGGLRRDALHAFRPDGVRDVAAAHGLLWALATAAPADEGVLWVTTAAHAREWGRPYAPGLAALGLEPARPLVIEARRPAEAAWAVEEGLRSRAFAAVLATGLRLDFPASRRLAVATADHHCPCFALDAVGNGAPLAAATLWGAAAAPSAPDPFDPHAPGPAAWRLTLRRARGGAPAGPWTVAWDEAARRFALAAPAADRAAATAPARRRDAAEPLRAERGRAARA